MRMKGIAKRGLWCTKKVCQRRLEDLGCNHNFTLWGWLEVDLGWASGGFKGFGLGGLGWVHGGFKVGFPLGWV